MKKFLKFLKDVLKGIVVNSAVLLLMAVPVWEILTSVLPLS